MMNRIYDFGEIQEIRLYQRKLVLNYALYTLCFIAAIILSCILIKNNLVLTVVFAIAILFFILFSICFWKIKYGILDSFVSFLDDLDTGKKDECIGVFEARADDLTDSESFDIYIFTSSQEKVQFLIHRQHKVCFDEGKKYHLTHVGKYLYGWESLD